MAIDIPVKKRRSAVVFKAFISDNLSFAINPKQVDILSKFQINPILPPGQDFTDHNELVKLIAR